MVQIRSNKSSGSAPRSSSSSSASKSASQTKLSSTGSSTKTQGCGLFSSSETKAANNNKTNLSNLELISSNKNLYEDMGLSLGKTSSANTKSGNTGGALSNTKDGKIGKTSQADEVGDCWLLTAVNSLSYSEKGRQIIKDSLKYNEDKNSTVVNFKGIGQKIEVTDEELKKAVQQKTVSSGDADMAILELAADKVRDKILNGDLTLAENNFIFTDSKFYNGKTNSTSLEAGYSLEMMYYLTGKTGEYASSTKDKNKLLDNLQKNGSKDYAMTASGAEEQTIKDAKGKSVKIEAEHSYSIKNADENTVTIANPWNSGEEITLSRKTFLNLFPDTYACNLSDTNKVEDYVIDTNIKIKEYDTGVKGKIIKAKDGTKLEKYEFNSSNEKAAFTEYGKMDNGNDWKLKYVYNTDNGNLHKTRERFIDENGDVIKIIRVLDENGRISKVLEYKNGVKVNAFIGQRDESGQLMGVVAKGYDGNGKRISRQKEEADRTYLQIFDGIVE